MADDTALRDGQDRTRINLHREHELRYWSEKFGVSQEALVAAVQEAGPLASAVEAWLGNRGRR